MKIEEIRDIIRYADHFYSKENGFLVTKALISEESKVADFYRVLVQTNIQDDRDVAKTIYGHPVLDPRYMFLKSHFTSKALNTITFIDLLHPDIPEYVRALCRAYK